jgi:hypothetical protein
MLALVLVLAIGASVFDVDKNTTVSDVADPQRSVIIGDTVDVYCDGKCPYDAWISEVSYIFRNGLLRRMFVVPVDEFEVPEVWTPSKRFGYGPHVGKCNDKAYYTYGDKHIMYCSSGYLGYPYMFIVP